MKSYWIDSVKTKKDYQRLTQDLETDVCIIGGGLTGITTAYYLNQYKIKNIILEKDRIGQKTTGHSTAKITSQHGIFYQYLKNAKGKEFAQKYYEANEKAIHNIESIIQKEKINCEFEKNSAYIFTQKIQEIEKIKQEVEVVKEIGGVAKYIEAKDIELNKISKENEEKQLKRKNQIKEQLNNVIPIKALCAIEFSNQAQFNVYEYLTQLAQKCEKGTTQIFENSKVIDIKGKLDNIDIKDSKTNYEIILEDGRKVKAKYIVIATKYPIINFPGLYFIKMYQETSNVIVIDPKEKPIKGMYINAENPVISIRNIKEKQKDLVIVAGFDHKTGAKIDLENSYRYLEEIAKSMYPNCEVKYRWNTEDCISLDKIPYIGEFSNMMPNVYVATGFKKWGMTTSNVAANIIVDKILEKKNEYEEIFKSTRLEPVQNGKELGNMIKQSIDSLVIEKMQIPKETLIQVQNGEGAVVEIGNKKVGVYKDIEGQVFQVKPVCMHLGCELSWNNLDKTWDCPCHGSRYDYKGNLIYGPSVKNLEK